MKSLYKMGRNDDVFISSYGMWMRGKEKEISIETTNGHILWNIFVEKNRLTHLIKARLKHEINIQVI
jgi:hypothetical protein